MNIVLSKQIENFHGEYCVPYSCLFVCEKNYKKFLIKTNVS
jgi:hypothetical protein